MIKLGLDARFSNFSSLSGFQLAPQLDRFLEVWRRCLFMSTQTTVVALRTRYLWSGPLRAECVCVWGGPSRCAQVLAPLRDTSPESGTRAPRARWGLPRPFPPPFPPSLAGKLRASISLLIALIRDRRGVNWKTLVLCLFGEENVNKN